MYLFTLLLSVLIYAASAQHNDKDRDYYQEFLRNPDSQRIHFRFQQRRRDQPEQIEERDESVGQYLGRPRYTSTTPEPFPTEPRYGSIQSFSEEQRPKPVSSFDADEWNQFYNSAPTFQPPSHHSDHFAARVSNKPSMKSPIQWHDPTSQFDQTAPQYNQDYQYYSSQPQDQQYQYQPEYTSQPKAQEYQQYYPEATSTTAFPETTPFDDAPQHYYVRQRAQTDGRHPSRGSHKFSEIDMNVPTESVFNVVPTQAPTTVAPTSRPRNPPPMPTLSPWSGDDFGK